MQVLGVSIDVGVGAKPVEIEALVRAVRVAVDIGLAAELARIRRSASERLKFPTDRELRNAVERLPQGDETSPQYRARRLLDTRRDLYERARSMPPEMWWDYLHRDRRDSKFTSRLVSGTGYERAFDAAPLPWFGGATLGLDVMDPDLYTALVADEIARLSPPEVTVRSVHYENPFGEELAVVGKGAEALTKVAGVIETSATLGARRKVAKSEAAVAEATVGARITASQLDAELKREELRGRRLANALAEEELLAKRIQNAQALDALGAQRRQRALVEHFTTAGQLDEADAIAAISPSDAAALREFAVRDAELTSSYEPDPDEDP